METDLIGPVLTNFVWDDRIRELATGEKQSEEWSVELQVPPLARAATLTLHPLSLSFPYTSRLFELLIPIL
jgi:hypothetical protein